MSADLFNLSGRAALITGGGAASARRWPAGLRRPAPDIFLASRTQSELESAAAEVADGLDVKVEWMSVDMTDRDQVDGLARGSCCTARQDRYSGQQPGSNIPAAIDEIIDDTWDQIVELNLSSACG